jgi:anthranilate synthase component I
MSRLEPSYERFAAEARPGTVIPLVREMLADALSPVVTYATIADEGEATYLLESVVGGEKWGRYSFVGFEPELIVRGVDDRFELLHPDGELEVRTMADPWTGVREVLGAYRPALASDMPRFWGGAVGYVGYDAVRAFEPTVGSRAPAVADSYDFSFAIGGTLIIFDTLRQTLRIVAPCRIQEGDDRRAAYQRGSERIERAAQWLQSPARPHSLTPPRRDTEVLIPVSTFERAAYCYAVERCKQYIAAGDIFQVVLSQRFRVPKDGVDAFDVYRALRVINPSPYMYFLRFGDLRIAGASPETLVRLEDGRAEVRPIAGTRPRGATEDEDTRIEREMFDDPKEIAEHVMLVDLGRNDLGRISVPGSVRLTERMITERFSHVMHITSNVEGRLAPGRDALDVLRATFPAGTLSGAPKVRAMQIIDELEPERRGIYGGAIGYIGFDGNMDVAIAIRTVVDRGGELHVQAGAGIVEASQPAAEYEECVNKARAALVAIASARRVKQRW